MDLRKPKHIQQKTTINSKYQKMSVLSMETLKKGDRVIYIGCSDVQVNWGSNGEPRKTLIEGATYYVEKVETHNLQTNLHLRGVYGKFNSVAFKKL